MDSKTGICILFILFVNEVDILCCHSQLRVTIREDDSKFQRIKGKGQRLIDEFGRERIFHGFNSIEKGPPWYDSQILNLTKLNYYKQWGFNVVRLGTMWSGVQPNKTHTNQTYINILKNIMGNLKDHGMYTLMDMHQDILTSKYNAYDGIPRWIIDSFPDPPHPFPWPLKGPIGNGDFRGYLSEAVSGGFQHFYDNYANARQYFIEFWKLIATQFKNNKNVLGYELINEPWVGNIYENPQLFLPGLSAERNLVPLYELTHEAIRTIDNETLIFFEPVTFGVVVVSEILGTGFSTVPGGPQYRDRGVLSWHYYCWIIGLDPFAFKANETFLQKLVCDEFLGPQIFNSVKTDTMKLRCPGFLTEFGNCAPDNDSGSVNTEECDFIMDLADTHKVSWSYWLSKFWLDNGDVNWPTVKAFARAYPKATQGDIVDFSFDISNAFFTMTYTINTTIKAPTEIFTPPLHYPHGLIVTTSQGLVWSYDTASMAIFVTPKPGFESAVHGTNCTVAISPKPVYRPWFHTIMNTINIWNGLNGRL